MKPATEILLSAAFVLTPEEQWNQQWQGADEGGNYVGPLSSRAQSWCLLGAIHAAAGVQDETESRVAMRAHVFVQKAAGLRDVYAEADFNNTHTHAEVLDALYRAAELSEAS